MLNFQGADSALEAAVAELEDELVAMANEL